MGSAVAALCGWGLYHDRWFLASTKKGQRLVRWFGEKRAVWVLRALCVLGILFGVFLATGVVNPINR